MAERTTYGIPLHVPSLTAPEALPLTRINLGSGEQDDQERYDERWVQMLVSRYPNILPIDAFEPAFQGAVSICMELEIGDSRIDNLFVTPSGNIIVGEAKLYRNPEARRTVVAQILDYAGVLSQMNYEALDKAVTEAEDPLSARGQATKQAKGIYAAVADDRSEDSLSESQFVDAVQKNLERGRFLLLVIGDGIRSSVESLSAFLQSHAGLHFTFGLVELQVYRMPGSKAGYIVNPSVLARTQSISRGIVTVESGKVLISAPAGNASSARAVASVPPTITEDEYFETLERNVPGSSEELRQVLRKLQDLSISTSYGRGTMILRWSPDGRELWNLGTILTDGKLWLDYLTQKAASKGILPLAHEFLEQLRKAIPGAEIKKTPKESSWYVAKNGRTITLRDMLDHQNEWISALSRFTQSVRNSLSST